MLYLPTQARFPIGGDCVTCPWLGCPNSRSPTIPCGNKNLNLRIVHDQESGPAQVNRGKFVCLSALSK